MRTMHHSPPVVSSWVRSLGRAASIHLLPVAATLALFCGACDAAKEQANKAEHALEKSSALGPDFELTKSTQGVLYTWVDSTGKFHITEKAEEVPAESRNPVRVAVDGKSPGTAEHVFVADLSVMDEAFPISVMERAKWEEMGHAAREKRVAELRPEEPESAPSPADLGVDAIIYGADWCKPCHLAEDYLKKKGARVVKKDIEEDSQAAAEMGQKLRAAGMSGNSIPVLDVGGTILRGFSQASIDRALKLAKK